MYRRLLILLVLPGMVQAKNLGTWGEMYPIAEQDMLTTIQTRLKAMEASGEMAREQEAFKQRVIENTLRPKPEVLRPARIVSARNAWCRLTVLN